jgi:hypothetical protein
VDSSPAIQPVDQVPQDEPVELQATLEAPTTTPESELNQGEQHSESAASNKTPPSETANGPQTEPAIAPSVEGSQMHQFFVSTVQGAVRVFVGVGVVPKYETFRLENPNRIVVDLPGVTVALPPDKLDQMVDHPQVQRVRAAQHRVDPPVARLVLDVNSFPKVEFFPQFNGLYIRVSENTE